MNPFNDMLKHISAETAPAKPCSVERMVLPFELALIRWSVTCKRWDELSAGHAPILTAFLAGWCCRCIGTSMPDNVGTFRDSFRIGWREADEQIEIASRQNEKGQP